MESQHICSSMLMTCLLQLNIVEVQRVKNQLLEKFDMKDLGNAKRILGMDIIRERSKGQPRLTI